MTELDRRYRIMRADEIGQAREVRDEVVIPQAKVADRAAAVAGDLGRLDEDQSRAAGGIAADIHQMPVGRMPALRHVLMHRRDHDAVFQGNAAQGKRGE
jgi:hypothetical protein